MTNYGFLLNTVLLAFLIWFGYRLHTLVNNSEKATLAADHNAKLRFLTYAARQIMSDLYTSLNLPTLTGCAKMYLRDDGKLDNIEVIMRLFMKTHNEIITKLSEGLVSDHLKITDVKVTHDLVTNEVLITLLYPNKVTDILVFHHNHLAQAIYQLDRLQHRLSTFHKAVPNRDLYQL
ncbi:hypothetical protein RAY_75 [Erwinia phage vB_EamM_RAY]|jgi:uncharacterized protein (UPF0333 family)|uniref:Uncharacterized protein n=8 Tax=Agricanvirus TaxID=1984776 RepID=A0A173GDX4_9CAUD|nr:hypothetical protein Ea357_075 [Erwinia phage Ea35-70]YP_009605542.1 hypothetical protein FDH98_gp075 [Erwinia phage vB_EamM_RAY]YP_009605862.1 hypothetical protein FDH99_gp078 [Erwinia phage vB_EamM_Simmy50]YP_009606184.1 hypothetical protein FDI00_gp078 [Erwinia phage vB_EamM_Special G]YP_009621816.1 hypothetical protein FDJ23_gp075 [Erwinia phage vB_EamM_Desertfox]AUG85864.1 hypothetical protein BOSOLAPHORUS_76 [Erwinia phage vB_EamM_Bosolaphorus]AUG86505.1 hypothetical protein MADMEL_7